MKNHIFSDRWHLLTGEQIVKLFDENFPNITIQPNINIVMQLKGLEVATLELLENRTASTVYRIRQTGVVYQLCQPKGDLFEFDDYEDYLNAHPVDKIIDKYILKELVHSVENIGGQIFIIRHKPPRFRGRYTPENKLSVVSEIQWYDGEPNYLVIANILRKACAFLNRYLKENEK